MSRHIKITQKAIFQSSVPARKKLVANHTVEGAPVGKDCQVLVSISDTIDSIPFIQDLPCHAKNSGNVAITMPLALREKLFGEEFPMSKVCGRFAECNSPINSFGWLDRRSFRNWKASSFQKEYLNSYHSFVLFETDKGE
ncbi:hypothetical protein AVEN_48990-1 [Araneus ventricosus]|uniref:Uncharacterized protein n=1 Tax=Araneus ventricosus TaxID=182803 RepID=A0A4Y2AGQ0_ARAVE|nr:hypothetical protein AVEN_48990-1 [Araneus ventricosus]